MTDAVMHALLDVACSGAASNFARHGALVPTVMVVDRHGNIAIVAVVGASSEIVRAELSRREAVAAVFISECWTAPARGDYETPARDRPDRQEVVRIEVHTPAGEHAREARIARKPDRLLSFVARPPTLAGPWARLLRKSDA